MVEIMLDLETMGKGPNAAITQIGAVVFDVEKRITLERLQVYVDLEDSVRNGGEMDASTVVWWLQQDADARNSFNYATLSVNESLDLFTELVLRHEPAEDEGVPVWGNGASFDNVILRRTYERAGKIAPWNFWQDRCYRTILKSLPGYPKVDFEGVKHLAVDDAMHQVRQLMAIQDWVEGRHPASKPELQL